MTGIPPSGTPGVFNGRNPTLLPNFDKPVASLNGTLDHQSPAAYLAANPRADATDTATLGGTVTTGDVVTLTITNPLLVLNAYGSNAGGSVSVSHTSASGDTLATIAEALAVAINDNSSLQALGVRADAAAAVITVHHNGPVGNFTTLTDAVSGSATETVTLANGGALSGGSGPVFAYNNFPFVFNGATMEFFAGQPYSLSYTLLNQIVSQGLPVV